MLRNNGTSNNEITLTDGDLSYYNDNKSYNYNIDTTLITLLEDFNVEPTYKIEYHEDTMMIEEDI